LEEQVEARTRQLQNAVNDLESFNYAVSHDLKAPLRHIGSYLDMIRDEVGEHPVLPLVNRCEIAIKRMTELIAGLLALSQLGHESLTLTRIDLTAMIHDYLNALPEQVNARLHIDIGPLPIVTADRVLLRQVVQNLIDNAIKYSGKMERPLLSIHDCTSSADEHIIEFRDNGIGFDADNAGKLFTLFQRMHRQDEYPGTGVGLALCAKIVQLHNGRIWVNAALGKGASFYIALPQK
jgi:light-regulated signal transduction histidine kinase (bacteriophytochrome)